MTKKGRVTESLGSSTVQFSKLERIIKVFGCWKQVFLDPVYLTTQVDF